MASSEVPIADQPTGGAIPSSTPPSKSAAPPPAVLRFGPKLVDIDAFLAHLHRCLQTPSGIDTVLQIVWASSCLAGALLRRHAPQRSARDLIALFLGLRPSSLKATTALPLGLRLKALSSLLAEARAIMRLWGLLAMYFWGRRLVASLSARTPSEKPSPAADEKPSWLSGSQLVASALFQVTDNSNLLSRHGVLGWTPAQQGRMARFGARAWCVFLGTEIGRLAFELVRRGDAQTKEEEATLARMQKSLVRNAAWAPIIFNGAAGGGFISEMTGATLAMLPSIIMMRDLWRNTADVGTG